MFLRRTSVIICLLIVAAIAGYYFFSTRPPAGVDSKGEGLDLDTLTALVASLVSLGGSAVGLLMKYQEIREKRLANRMTELDILEREKELAKK